MDKINVFGGYGFVGGWFSERYDVVRNDRDDYIPKTNNILSFISTVDNYNLSRGLPFEDINSNIVVMLQMLENAREKYGSEFTFNFISSWFVYGKIDVIPATEDTYCNPTGFYSITKRCAEQLLISYCETYGISYRILRLSNILGAGDNKTSVKKNATQHMIRELVQGRPIRLYEGIFLRDFLDVRDAVRAIHLVVTKGRTNEIFNIGSGAGVAICDLVEYVHDWFPDSIVEKIPVPEFHKLVQVENMYLDVSKLKELGFSLRHPIHETLDWLMEYYG